MQQSVRTELRDQLSVQQIIARIERLPSSKWDVRVRLIMGAATFFDGFDSLAIASVMPVLAGLWKLPPRDIGLLMSAGFFGQLLGAIIFGRVAERIGRVSAATWTVAIFSLMSLLCAFSWSYRSLLIFRLLQGFALGGEVPIAAAYINELGQAKKRGRFFMLYQSSFTIGILGVSIVGAWVVPYLGWRYMFVIGVVPAVLIIFFRRFLPESPRWLASRGRLEEADRVVTAIENELSENGRKPLPPLAQLPATAPVYGSANTGNPVRRGGLFQGMYLGRTLCVWLLMFCCFFVAYGLTTWIPTVLRTVFKMPVHQALLFNVVFNAVLVLSIVSSAFIIDKLGRRVSLGGAYLLSSLPLLVIWYMGFRLSLSSFVLLAISYGLGGTISLALFLYTPEIYPTRMRAHGVSVASSWARIASIAGPFVVGFLVAGYGLKTVFLTFGVVALIGAVASKLFVVETSGRVLEEISPDSEPFVTRATEA